MSDKSTDVSAVSVKDLFPLWSPPENAVLKLHVGDSVHRVPGWLLFRGSGSKGSFKRLERTANKFRSKKKVDEAVKFIYKDEDGDIVTISTAYELVDAWMQFLPDDGHRKKLKILAIFEDDPPEVAKAFATLNVTLSPSLEELKSTPLSCSTNQSDVNESDAAKEVAEKIVQSVKSSGKEESTPASCFKSEPDEVAEKIIEGVFSKSPTSNNCATSKDETRVSNLSSDFIHARHTCDVCLRAPIRGLRYHATNLCDYDLCSDCFANYKGDDIVFQAEECERDRARQKVWRKRAEKGGSFCVGVRRGRQKCKKSCSEGSLTAKRADETGNVNAQSSDVTHEVYALNEADAINEAIRNSLVEQKDYAEAAASTFQSNKTPCPIENQEKNDDAKSTETFNNSSAGCITDKKGESEVDLVLEENDELSSRPSLDITLPGEAKAKSMPEEDRHNIESKNTPMPDCVPEKLVTCSEECESKTKTMSGNAATTPESNKNLKPCKNETNQVLSLSEDKTDDSNHVEVRPFAGESVSAMTSSIVSGISEVKIDEDNVLSTPGNHDDESDASYNSFVSVNETDDLAKAENADEEESNLPASMTIEDLDEKNSIDTKKPEEDQIADPESSVSKTIIESVAALSKKDDESNGSVRSDDWNLVENQVDSNEMLGRAAQAIGSAMFNSAMTGSGTENSNSTKEVGVISVSTSSSESSVSSVPSIGSSISLPTINSAVSGPLMSRWGKHLKQLKEIGFSDEQEALMALETLQAANIGSGSTDSVTVSDAVNYLLR